MLESARGKIDIGEIKCKIFSDPESFGTFATYSLQIVFSDRVSTSKQKSQFLFGHLLLDTIPDTGIE
jgi:hypothetical protein